MTAFWAPIHPNGRRSSCFSRLGCRHWRLLVHFGRYGRGRSACNRATAYGESAAMTFTETTLPGAVIVDIERRGDDRGFFARSYCEREFAAHGLKPRVAQANVSFNRRRGTVRG